MVKKIIGWILVGWFSLAAISSLMSVITRSRLPTPHYISKYWHLSSLPAFFLAILIVALSYHFLLKKNTKSAENGRGITDDSNGFTPANIRKISSFNIQKPSDLEITSKVGGEPARANKNQERIKLGSYANAKLAIEYSPKTSEAWQKVQSWPPELQDEFLRQLDADPQLSGLEIFDKLSQELEKIKRPNESDELNDAYKKVTEIGVKAVAEFERVISVLGPNLDVKAVVSRIEEKFLNDVQIKLNDAIKEGREEEIIEVLRSIGFTITEEKDRYTLDAAYKLTLLGSLVGTFPNREEAIGSAIREARKES